MKRVKFCGTLQMCAHILVCTALICATLMCATLMCVALMCAT